MYNRIKEGSIDESDQTRIPATLLREFIDCRHTCRSHKKQRNFNEPVSIVSVLQSSLEPRVYPQTQRKNENFPSNISDETNARIGDNIVSIGCLLR